MKSNIKSSPIRISLTAIALSVYLYAAPQMLSFAQGNLQSWNNNQRERAERLLSGAMTALNKGQIEQASSLLKQATLADPTDPAPLAELGVVEVQQGKYADALEALRKSYKLKHLTETLISTGFAYYLQHDYDAAIASWTKALEREPKLLELNGDIGFAYLRQGDFVKSDESFRMLVKARPNSQFAYHGLALLNYLSGHFFAARKAAEHAESIESYYPVLLLLAKLDYLQGDTQTGQKRVSSWQRASSGKRAIERSMTAIGYPTQHDFHWDPFLADNFDSGRFLLARAKPQEKNGESRRKSLAQKGKGQDPLEKAKQALSTAAKDFYITREVALIESAYADYAQSAEHFSDVLQECPACTVDWLHLARAQALQNKSTEAAYAINEFLRQRPDEKLAPGFMALAKGQAVTPPDLGPLGPTKTKGAEDGF